jgi:hypothetical protein
MIDSLVIIRTNVGSSFVGDFSAARKYSASKYILIFRDLRTEAVEIGVNVRCERLDDD